jgi:hypothetical protein
LSAPPASASTILATEPYATHNIDMKDASHSDNTSSEPSYPVGDIDGCSDSDLTEIDELPDVADATVRSRSGNVDGDSKDDSTIFYATGSTHRSTRPHLPTHRKILAREETEAEANDHNPQHHSLLTPTKPSNCIVTHLPPQLSQSKVTKTEWKAKDARLDDFVERRTSTRLQNTVTKRSFSEYVGDDNSSITGHASSSAGSSKAAAQIINLKVEAEEKDVLAGDLWKTGWSKADSWAKVSPKVESAPKDVPVVTNPNQKYLAIKGNSIHEQSKKPQSKYGKAKSGRVDCPRGCGMSFGRAHDAYRHADESMVCGSGQKGYVCPDCGHHFSRRDALKRHQGRLDPNKRLGPRQCAGLRR